MINIDKFRGCMIGLALGDALCAPFEGGILERSLWKLLGKTKDNKIRYTDDTQMSIDIAKSIISYKKINQDAMALSFAQSYRWSRGYGPNAAKLLKSIGNGQDWRILNTKYFNNGSYGNGAAMRIAPVALFFHIDRYSLLEAVKESSIITHAHDLAIHGAMNIATTIALLLNEQSVLKITEKLIKENSAEYKKKLIIAKQWLQSNQPIPVNLVVKELGNGIQAINSTVTAIFIGLNFIEKEYSDMIEFIQKCKGDSDTIAAMAGAIWGVANGLDAINHPMLEKLESKNEIIELADTLFYLQHQSHDKIE